VLRRHHGESTRGEMQRGAAFAMLPISHPSSQPQPAFASQGAHWSAANARAYTEYDVNQYATSPRPRPQAPAPRLWDGRGGVGIGVGVEGWSVQGLASGSVGQLGRGVPHRQGGYASLLCRPLVARPPGTRTRLPLPRLNPTSPGPA
jgi:hypothetical protein